jgi:hypothetical protein
MRVRAKSEDIVEVYLDESSQTKHRYLVLGAVALEMPSSQKLTDLLAYQMRLLLARFLVFRCLEPFGLPSFAYLL